MVENMTNEEYEEFIRLVDNANKADIARLSLGDKYFYISDSGLVVEAIWTNSPVSNWRLLTDNVYVTEDLAEIGKRKQLNRKDWKRLAIYFMTEIETIEGYLEKEAAMCKALQSNEDTEGRALYQGYTFAYEDILNRIKNIEEVNLDEEDR